MIPARKTKLFAKFCVKFADNPLTLKINKLDETPNTNPISGGTGSIFKEDSGFAIKF